MVVLRSETRLLPARAAVAGTRSESAIDICKGARAGAPNHNCPVGAGGNGTYTFDGLRNGEVVGNHVSWEPDVPFPTPGRIAHLPTLPSVSGVAGRVSAGEPGCAREVGFSDEILCFRL